MPFDDLTDLDPVDLMAAEAARIEAYVPTLSDAQLAQPSRCEGWSVRDVVAHLAASEEYHRACLDGRVAEYLTEVLSRGATDVAQFNALGIAEFDGVAVDEVLRRFVEDDADTRRRYRVLGDGEVDTTVGMYPARWQAFHLASELATHADDIAVPVAEGDAEARRQWRTRFSVASLEEFASDLEVEHTEGRTRVTGRGVDVELDDDELVDAVAGRAAPDLPADARAALSTMP